MRRKNNCKKAGHSWWFFQCAKGEPHYSGRGWLFVLLFWNKKNERVRSSCTWFLIMVQVVPQVKCTFDARCKSMIQSVENSSAFVFEQSCTENNQSSLIHCLLDHFPFWSDRKSIVPSESLVGKSGPDYKTGKQCTISLSSDSRLSPFWLLAISHFYLRPISG